LWNCDGGGCPCNSKNDNQHDKLSFTIHLPSTLSFPKLYQFKSAPCDRQVLFRTDLWTIHATYRSLRFSNNFPRPLR
jgi:hypothetical protein